MNARSFDEDDALAANVTPAYAAAVTALQRSERTDMGSLSSAELYALQAQAQASLAVADAIVWAADVVVEWFSPAEQPSPVADLSAPGSVEQQPTYQTRLVSPWREDEEERPGRDLELRVVGSRDLTAVQAGGVQLIAHERVRQVAELGYTLEHDRRHRVRDFMGAAVLLLGGQPPFPPAFTCERANPGSSIYELDDLVRTGALIAAAIDRLQETRP